jgi:prepilin-type N-terminal cleavage/methylation domain-containing protein
MVERGGCMFRVQIERLSAQGGFTLIELLGVAVIFVILSVMALPVYAEVSDKARTARSCEELRLIEEQLDSYQLDSGFYPTTLNSLVTAGYIKETTKLESPWSNQQTTIPYYYAVNNASVPTEFIVGDPGLQGNCGLQKVSCVGAQPWLKLPAEMRLGGARCSR